MNHPSHPQNIKIIYRMLFEMATDNLTFRISLEDCDEKLKELAMMLNALAEKMQLLFSQLEDIPSIHKPSNAASTPSDAVLLQNVYDYILEHLDEPLPSAKELSKIFGTNEFKLKDSFRHFFNTTLYQFYTEERLKKAHQLLLKTNLPLKEVAFMSGFSTYITFYKAFTKQFHYSPSELKGTITEDNN